MCTNFKNSTLVHLDNKQRPSVPLSCQSHVSATCQPHVPHNLPEHLQPPPRSPSPPHSLHAAHVTVSTLVDTDPSVWGAWEGAVCAGRGWYRWEGMLCKHVPQWKVYIDMVAEHEHNSWSTPHFIKYELFIYNCSRLQMYYICKTWHTSNCVLIKNISTDVQSVT